MSDGADADDVDPFVGARKSGFDIRYMAISDGFSLGFDRGVNLVEYWESMILDFPDRVDELVGRIVTTSSDERAVQATAYLLIADSLYTWPATIAAKHKLVNVCFGRNQHSCSRYAITWTFSEKMDTCRSKAVDWIA